MRKLVPLFLFACMLFSCSTDKIDALEEAIDKTVELPDEEKAPDENPVDNTEAGYFIDSFDTDGDLIDYVTNNASALPNVSSLDERYKAVLDDNTNNITLHFHEDQGRIDAKLVTFPFEFIARNIGIGTLADSQTAPSPNGNPYLFSGVQVHHKDFNSINSTHVVVGHRGGAEFTIEGKNTVDGSSSVNDIGANTAPAGRADIRIVGTEERELIIYWQTPNLDYETVDDTWNLYRDTGDLPGATPAYDEEVYVGLITYAYGQTGVPFVGTCDAIEIRD